MVNRRTSSSGPASPAPRRLKALREEGFEGRIVVVGDESEQPYERPPLSKDYLRGQSGRREAHVHPEAFYRDKQIELRLATRVERIDVAGRQLALTGGEALRYNRLMLATGAEARRLDVPGADLVGVHYLRDVDEADAIAARLRKGKRVVVIGAGWIGCEVAASARQQGLDVTLVERDVVPLERVLGRQAGGFYAQLHRDHGVDVRTGTELARFEGKYHVRRVRLADGSAIECDFVVVGIGATPRTQLAAWAGVAVDNGILVSRRLEATVSGVFAAGDVANAFHPFYGRHLRVEHWANALHQPATAARAMLGKPASYERLPYFYSDQYDVGMEYTGYATEWDEVLFRGDPATREFMAFWLQDGRVVAGMNVNVWDVVDTVEGLIRSRRRVDTSRLRDPDIPLEQVMPEAHRVVAAVPRDLASDTSAAVASQCERIAITQRRAS